MNRADGRAVGLAGGKTTLPGEALVRLAQDHLPIRPSAPLTNLCNRCGFPVTSRAFGCKNPCANCGTVYPLGDCSD